MMLRTIKVLIVDDNADKAAAVGAAVAEFAFNIAKPQVEICNTLAAAAEAIGRDAFDLIVLDLMVPFIDGTAPEASAGLELLRQIRKDSSKNRLASVLGLSAFPEEMGRVIADFTKLGVVISAYDASGEWLSPLRRLFLVALNALPEIESIDFVIVVALDEERDAYARTELKVLGEAIVNGLSLSYVDLDGKTGALIRCRRMGLAAAINDTAIALRTFKPKVAAMSGVCAGVSGEVTLGQLVLASLAWEYQAGKWATNGFEMAPFTIPMRTETLAIAENALKEDVFLSSLESGLDFTVSRPSNRVAPRSAPFASGSAVIADDRKLQHILPQHRKLAAIDMEVYGLYYSCHESAYLVEHFFAVKCVVDLADKKKGDSLHSYGAITSARSTLHVIRKIFS